MPMWGIRVVPPTEQQFQRGLLIIWTFNFLMFVTAMFFLVREFV